MKGVTIITYLILLVLAVSTIFPFFWMFSTSLKPLKEVYTLPPSLIPQEVRIENFLEAFEGVNFTQALINSVVYVALYSFYILFLLYSL